MNRLASFALLSAVTLAAFAAASGCGGGGDDSTTTQPSIVSTGGTSAGHAGGSAAGASGAAGHAAGSAGHALGGSGGSSAAGASGKGGAAGASGSGGAGASGKGGSSGSGGKAGGGAAGASGASGHAGSGPVATLSILPPSVTLQIPVGTTAPQTYQVLSTVSGQQPTDVTSTCDFSLQSGMGLGSFVGATLTAKAVAGMTNVVASCGGMAVDSSLTIHVTDVVLGTGVPPNVVGLFGGATPGTDASMTPLIEYPLDGAVTPANIPPIDAQWTTAGNDLFHLSFTSPLATADVYTTGADALLAEADWNSISAASAGQDLVVTVEALQSATPTTKYVSTPVTLHVSNDTIDNSAIYWWASSKGSLFTQTFGNTDAPAPVEADCTACHSLSRAGTRLGYSRCVAGDCGQLYAGFLKVDSSTGVWSEQINANDEKIHGSYTTFSPIGNPFPDDTQSLAIVSLLDSTGHLELYDPDTGLVVPSNLVASAAMSSPTGSTLMADWSPDGTSIAFVSTPHAGQWIDLDDGTIETMSYAYQGGQHVFGTPKTLIAPPLTAASGSYTNLFFPSYSPDGALVVFDGARTAWRNLTDATAPGQRLFLTNAAGDWSVELAQMNGEGDLNVTWAHWAPTQSSDYAWLVYSTERVYGHLLTPANSAPACIENGVKQCKQIWIAAIAKSKIPAQGGMVPPMDPSSPPMWLPGQDIGADNISPYWTVPAIKQ